jgi:hypothetical protein
VPGAYYQFHYVNKINDPHPEQRSFFYFELPGRINKASVEAGSRFNFPKRRMKKMKNTRSGAATFLASAQHSDK